MAENSEYIVSARKYRPQTFVSMVGQGHITQTLQNAIAKGQMAHAYLFTGPRGVGKTTCARIFARAINCLNPTPEHEACGTCESCVAFAADRSFNIHEMDAASNNSVDDIRILNDKVRVAPQIGKYSVYIIDEAHMLSAAAFNAFLKTLEEPPAHAIFIMATTEKHKILPTILSRCQTYDFKRIRLEDIVGYLRHIATQEGVSTDDESLHIIASKADGGMRDALSTFDRVVSFCGQNLTSDQVAEAVGALDYNTYIKCVEMAQAGDYSGLLMMFDGVLAKGFDGQHFLGGLAEHLRNLLVAKNPQTVSLLELSGSVAQAYAAQAAGLSVEFLFSAINLVSTADAGYRTATSRRLHVELCLMKLSGMSNPITPIPNAQLPKVSGNTAENTPTATPAPENTAPAPAPTETTTTAPEPVAEPAHTPTPEPTPAPAPTIGGSMLGVSINPAKTQNTQPEQQLEKKKCDPELGLKNLTENFQKLVELWENRMKPRMATALGTAQISTTEITLTVPNEIMEAEISNAKVDLDTDMMELFNFRLPIKIEVVEEVKIERPVTVQQKLEHLGDKNPTLLKLREALDLSL